LKTKDPASLPNGRKTGKPMTHKADVEKLPQPAALQLTAPFACLYFAMVDLSVQSFGYLIDLLQTEIFSRQLGVER